MLDNTLRLRAGKTARAAVSAVASIAILAEIGAIGFFFFLAFSVAFQIFQAESIASGIAQAIASIVLALVAYEFFASALGEDLRKAYPDAKILQRLMATWEAMRCSRERTTRMYAYRDLLWSGMSNRAARALSGLDGNELRREERWYGR